MLNRTLKKFTSLELALFAILILAAISVWHFGHTAAPWLRFGERKGGGHISQTLGPVDWKSGKVVVRDYARHPGMNDHQVEWEGPEGEVIVLLDVGDFDPVPSVLDDGRLQVTWVDAGSDRKYPHNQSTWATPHSEPVSVKFEDHPPSP